MSENNTIMLNPSQTFIEIYNESLNLRPYENTNLGSFNCEEENKEEGFFKRFIIYMGSKFFINNKKFHD